MSTTGTGVEVKGIEQTIKNLRVLPDQIAVEVKDKVLRKAAMPIVTAARAIAPKDEGLFDQSIGVKLWPPGRERLEMGVVMAIIGSKRGKQYGGRSNIAHLLERGWRIASGGTLERTGGGSSTSLTGRTGQGVSMRFREGWHMFEKAARSAGGTAAAIIVSETPRIVERVWRNRKGRTYAG